MRETPFFGWTYPDENEDPYDDNITSFYAQQEDTVFGLMNTAANLIIPPSTISWNPFTLTLTWNADFEFPLMSVAFSFFVQYGPDGLNRTATFIDGSRLVCTVPRTASQNLYGNFSVITSTPVLTSGLFTVGFCRGNKFYANFPQVYT